MVISLGDLLLVISTSKMIGDLDWTWLIRKCYLVGVVKKFNVGLEKKEERFNVIMLGENKKEDSI